MSEIELANRAYQNGLLNPEVPSGKGTIIEYVVLSVMEDCTKESFNFPYDLTSKRLGEINVKSSSRHKNQNGNVWTFGKKPDSYIPDHYVCVGLDESYSKVLHVWEIPGSERVVGSHGIYVIDSPKGLKRVAKYEVDPAQYDDVFQSMNIAEFPEFKNAYDDFLKRNLEIARKVNENISVDEIEKEYGKESYQEYIHWIYTNGLKKYFNKSTGLVGIYKNDSFEEFTDFTYPVFDCRGEYVGHILRGSFEKYRVKIKLNDRLNQIRLVRKAVYELTEKYGNATLEEIKDLSGIENAETHLIRMVHYGDIESVDEYNYICHNQQSQEMCMAERMEIIINAFKKLSKIDRKIYLHQLEEETGLKNMDAEFNYLKKRSALIQINDTEFRWI